MTIDDARRRLIAIRDAIDDAIHAIDSGLPYPPGEALEKMDQGICLKCGKKIKRDQQARRYCHESCYRILMHRIQEGEITEDQLINDGLLGPELLQVALGSRTGKIGNKPHAVSFCFERLLQLYCTLQFKAITHQQSIKHDPTHTPPDL